MPNKGNLYFRISDMNKYEITCEECLTSFDVLSDSTERADYCPFCGEFMPIQSDWDEEEDIFDE